MDGMKMEFTSLSIIERYEPFRHRSSCSTYTHIDSSSSLSCTASISGAYATETSTNGTCCERGGVG